MDCTHLNTAAEVLEDFRACNNPGEQIELFECLATRPEPPLEAFVELLKNIHLEPVLALTIQAFGKITDADLKARLKQSDDLLAMLSQQVQSGSTDFIRWCAVATIESVGFDFIAVSQRLSEEPRHIAERIMQPKVKRFVDPNLVQSNDYDEFIRFWTYSSRDKLREVTLGYKFWELKEEWQSKKERGWRDSRNEQEVERLNKFSVCWDVMNNLDLRGLKEANSALQKAEAMADQAMDTDENELFEGIAHILSAEKILGKQNADRSLLIETHVHCLQSNDPKTIYAAALILKSLSDVFLDNPTLRLTVFIFSCKEEELFDYPYKQLEKIHNDLLEISKVVSRRKVKSYCKVLALKLSTKMLDRQTKYEDFQNRLNQIKSINNQLYEQVLSREDTQLLQWLLDDDEKLLAAQLGYLRIQIGSFYDSLTVSQLSSLKEEIEITKEGLELTKIIAHSLDIIFKISAIIIFPYMAISAITRWSWWGVIILQIIVVFILVIFVHSLYDILFDSFDVFSITSHFRNKLNKKQSLCYEEENLLRKEKKQVIELLSILKFSGCY